MEQSVNEEEQQEEEPALLTYQRDADSCMSPLFLPMGDCHQ